MKIRILHAVAACWSLSKLLAQAPVIEWQSALGGGNVDRASSISPTTDGGYAVAGFTASADGDVTNNNGIRDFWVVKLGDTGTIQWQNTFGGGNIDQARTIAQIGDGGYLVAGETWSSNGDVTNHHGACDYWIIKVDSVGTLQWQSALGGSGADYATATSLTADGGCTVAGYSNSSDGDVTNNHGGFDFWIVKLDSTGVLEWEHAYGGSDQDLASAISNTADGGYIVAGSTYSTDGDITGHHGDVDYWVVKLDSSGSIQWQNTYGGSDEEGATAVAQTADGGYIVAGYARSTDGDITMNHGGADYWIVKLDPAGTVQWQSTFGGGNDEIAASMSPSSGGGHVVAGFTYSVDGDITNNHGDMDYWVVSFDEYGSMQWQRALGGSVADDATSVEATSDGGCVVAGSAFSNDGDVTNNHGDYDHWIVKLSGGTGAVSDEVLDRGILNVFPNPASASIRITSHLQRATIFLTDGIGREVFAAPMNAATHVLDVTYLPRGLYTVSVHNAQGVQVQRIVLE